MSEDIILACSHRWRRLLVQAPEFPHSNVSFLCWECANAGCDTKISQGKLTPVGLGGEMTEEIRIVGPQGGPVILKAGGLAKEIIRNEEGELDIHYYNGME